jgi:putative lipoprotein
VKRLFAVLLLIPCLSFADSWTTPDKPVHATVSFVLGLSTSQLFPQSKLTAFGVAMIPGVAKEVLDAGHGGSGFSLKDLGADAIGAALGVYTGGWLLSRSQKTTVVAYMTEF